MSSPDPSVLASLASVVRAAAVSAGTLAALATVPGTIELAVVTAGAWMDRPDPATGSRKKIRPRPVRRVAVVVPAHDEEDGIERCVASLLACDTPGFEARVVVVADNCSDATATRAALAGARVLPRFDADLRGKGHALAFAFEALMAEGFDAFVVVDADTSVTRNLLSALVAELEDGFDAAQAPYGVRNADASPRTRLMQLALLAFNHLRPRGRAGLGLSVGILGNGFALSRAALEEVPWEASSIVEDLEYHLRLVAAGRRVGLAEDAAVFADMPVGSGAAAQQRARWEGGRLRMVREHAPRLAREIARGCTSLVEPLLELLLAPLAMHVLLACLCLVTPSAPVAAWGVVALGVVVVHVATAALRCGNGWSDLAPLAGLPAYLVWKAGMLPATLLASTRDTAWTRTAREGAAEGAR